MTRQFAFCRAASHVFVCSWAGMEKTEPGGRGLPDKSTAVCRGTCGCLLEVFSAAHGITPMAMRVETSIKAPLEAPSLSLLASTGGQN